MWYILIISLFSLSPSTHLINDKQKKLRGKSLSLKYTQRTISAQIFRKFFIREKRKEEENFPSTNYFIS
jgi:hypothetical protein